MSLPIDFFPRLTRRDSYSKKKDGNYYAEYAHYREEVAEDCLFRCAYCDVHQEEIGGERLMQLDHFRPKSRPEYATLVNDPTNLLYACFVCNSQKSDLWPAKAKEKTHEDGAGFVDPFHTDRSTVFECESAGRLSVRADPGAYLIHLLLLNRPFMCRLREVRHLRRAILN